MIKETIFYSQVYKFAGKIPYGSVTTYGHIAIALGRPHNARAVGYALSLLPENTSVPWHRIINRLGKISIKSNFFSRDMQKVLLIQEGIIFDSDDKIDLDRFGWFAS